MSTVESDQRPPTEQRPDGHSATDKLGEVVQQVKPKLRGWLHAGMAPLATAGGIVLVALAPDESCSDRRGDLPCRFVAAVRHQRDLPPLRLGSPR